MLQKQITAVIVSYYRSKRLQRCIESLHELENILVYDNNTTGQDLDNIKKLSYPNTKFIFNAENVGLTKAWNTGIIQSETDWVLLTCDDMIFDSDWLDIANSIIINNPRLEQIHLNAWNAILIHKRSIVRMGWWDERYRFYPSMEDDDWYLRTVELLGYSPYGTYNPMYNFSKPYIDALKPFLDIKEQLFNSEDNITYYCNSEYSKYKIIGKSTITGQEDDAGSRNNSGGSFEKTGITGVEFHHQKWQPLYFPDKLNKADRGLLGKDGRIWKRIMPDIDFYPLVRKEYAKKYFGILI